MSDILLSDFILSRHRAGDPKVRVFYKYQTWRSYTETTLSAQSIYLSKLAELNDPFDPFLSALASTHHTDRLAGDAYTVELFSMLADTGIFCLAERPDNQLLWAHYANSFRGFCIGYAVFMDPCLQILHRVKYSEYLPEQFRSHTISPHDLIQGSLVHKPEVWRYEQEWRFLMSGNVGVIQSLFPVVEVIFGLRMTDDDQKALIAATAPVDPMFRQVRAILKDGKYQLRLKDIGRLSTRRRELRNKSRTRDSASRKPKQKTVVDSN